MVADSGLRARPYSSLERCTVAGIPDIRDYDGPRYGGSSRLGSYREAMSHKISLVVDDEPSVRDFIVAVLQGDGFQTIEAENGVHALELMHKLGGAVDLLVSDIKMPLMDGITLACSVRAEFPAIPLILVSGYAEIEQAKLPNSGFEFVQTPVSSGHTSECSEEGDGVEEHSIFGRDRNGNLNAFTASLAMIGGATHQRIEDGDGGEPRSCRTFANTSSASTGFLTNMTCNSDRCFLRIGTWASMLTSTNSRWIGLECTLTTSNKCAQSSASRTWKPFRCKQCTRGPSNPSSSRATRTVG